MACQTLTEKELFKDSHVADAPQNDRKISPQNDRKIPPQNDRRAPLRNENSDWTIQKVDYCKVMYLLRMTPFLSVSIMKGRADRSNLSNKRFANDGSDASILSILTISTR